MLFNKYKWNVDVDVKSVIKAQNNLLMLMSDEYIKC